MKRRSYLALVSSLPFAGCNTRDSSEPGTTEPSTETPPKTQTPEPTGTTTQTENLDVKERHSLEEWHKTDSWNISVQSFELTDKFSVDGQTFKMPEAKQLAIATAKVENRTSADQSWAIPFAFISNGETVYESQMEFDHPEFSYEVDIRQLAQVEHQKQFSPSGLPVGSGEIEQLWAVAVLPRSISRRDVEVGLKSETSEMAYPIRWAES
ncbi:MAG: hypothetical protein ABEH81_10985 [Halopenitus sp.]